MSTPLPRPTSWVFLLLLVLALAQVVWWIYDQSRYSRARQAELLEAYEAERATAEELYQAAAPLGNASFSEVLEERFPHLEVHADEVRIRPAALAALDRERRSHMNQYWWEGTFFLLVLLAGIWVIRRTLLREQELRLRQENFLAAVSHELKSPLQSLRLAGDTLVRPELSEERRSQLLERNRRDLDRLEDLIHKLLDTSRLEAGKTELGSHEVALEPAIHEVVNELQRSSAPGSTAVEIEVEVPTNLILRTDPAALETIVRNLLANALVAVRDTAEPRVVVRAARDSSGTWLEVLDNGVGFEPSESEKLFEKFYRPGSEMQRETRGSGLGLYLVRRFVELEGGTVLARSQGPGTGACFRVSWV